MLELLVVMAILAILSLAIAPWFAKISQRNQLKSATQEFATTLMAARMRAVKRNLPARVVITRVGPLNNWILVETFEQTTPTPIKVAEIKLSPNFDFPTSGTTYAQLGGAPPYHVDFGPDGRRQNGAVGRDEHYTLRGPLTAAVTNDLPVRITPSGAIRVLKPNPIWPTKPDGTEWH